MFACMHAYNTIQCNAMHCDAMHCNWTTQHNTIQHNTIQYNNHLYIFIKRDTDKERKCWNMFPLCAFVLIHCSLEIMPVNVLNKIEGVKWATGLLLHTMLFAWTISHQITQLSRVQPLRFLNELVICPTVYNSFYLLIHAEIKLIQKS